MSERLAVVAENLRKRYRAPGGGSFAALDGLSLSVRHGETLALLGPNGAGKTTTLEIIEGLTAADGGRVRVLGLDPRREPSAVLERVGIQLQSAAYFERLRLAELLELFGRLYRRRLAPAELLARVGLLDKARAFVAELSGGQAQRFSIVAALVNDPEILFLDEPSTGLDPRARRDVWNLVDDLASDGRTVILTTHYMEEARALADRVAFVDRGRVVAVDTPEALLARHGPPTAIEFLVNREIGTAALGDLPAVTAVTTSAAAASRRRVTLAVEAVPVAMVALFDRAGSLGVELAELRVRPPTLEEVFLALTGDTLAGRAPAGAGG